MPGDFHAPEIIPQSGNCFTGRRRKKRKNNPAAIPNYQQVKPASALTLASLRNPIVSALPNAMQSAPMPGQPTPTPLVNGTITYSYDAVGNQIQVVSTVPQIPSSGTMFYDANDRLSTDSYDNNGDTINSGGIQNVYDFEGHLIKHGNIDMVYDGDGNRVSKTVAGVTTSYLVDDKSPSGYSQVLEEQQNGSVVRKYAYGLNLISENQQINNSWTPSWYIFDGHSGVRGLTDSSGLLTDQYMYNGYGTLLATSGATPNFYLYRGQQFDPDLNLYYNRARYLDVRRGRFWSMDTDEGDDNTPITLHKYLYANADPLDNFDPYGRDAIATTMASLGISMTLDAIPNVVAQQSLHAAIPLAQYPDTQPARQLVGAVYAESSTPATGGENFPEKVLIGETFLYEAFVNQQCPRYNNFGGGT